MKLVGDYIHLVLIRAVSYLLPLLALPYLASVLGKEALGDLLFYQSFAMFASLIVEYGFYLSGTRAVAQCESHDQRAIIVGEVTSAKAILSLVVLVLSLVLFVAIDSFSSPILLSISTLLAISQGFSPSWFLHGCGRLRRASIIEAAARTIAVFAAILVIRDRDDGYLFILMQLVASFISNAVLTREIATSYGRFCLSFEGAAMRLRDGLGLFYFRASSSLYTTANAVLLGLLASKGDVAIFVIADRLVRGGLSFVLPLTQASFPQISRVFGHRDLVRAKAHLLFVGMLMAVLVLVVVTSILLFAKYGVGLIFDREYADLARLLQFYCLLVPAVAVNNFLGTNLLLPKRMDVAFNVSITIGALVNLTFAIVFLPEYGARGMAWAAVLAELAVVIAMAASLLVHRQKWGVEEAPQ